jgi:hypothetical protein
MVASWFSRSNPFSRSFPPDSFPAGARLAATWTPSTREAVEGPTCLANERHRDRNDTRSRVPTMGTQDRLTSQRRPRAGSSGRSKSFEVRTTTNKRRPRAATL